MSAARQRRRRQRIAAGRTLVHVEIAEELVAALRAVGWVGDSEDRASVEQGVQRLLDAYTERIVTRDPPNF